MAARGRRPASGLLHLDVAVPHSCVAAHRVDQRHALFADDVFHHGQHRGRLLAPVARREVERVRLQQLAVLPVLIVYRRALARRGAVNPHAVGIAVGVALPAEGAVAETAADGAHGLAARHRQREHHHARARPYAVGVATAYVAGRALGDAVYIVYRETAAVAPAPPLVLPPAGLAAPGVTAAKLDDAVVVGTVEKQRAGRHRPAGKGKRTVVDAPRRRFKVNVARVAAMVWPGIRETPFADTPYEAPSAKQTS